RSHLNRGGTSAKSLTTKEVRAERSLFGGLSRAPKVRLVVATQTEPAPPKAKHRSASARSQNDPQCGRSVNRVLRAGDAAPLLGRVPTIHRRPHRLFMESGHCASDLPMLGPGRARAGPPPFQSFVTTRSMVDSGSSARNRCKSLILSSWLFT